MNMTKAKSNGQKRSHRGGAQPGWRTPSHIARHSETGADAHHAAEGPAADISVNSPGNVIAKKVTGYEKGK